ncbi:tail fiber protein [Flavobacteriaceae bacterium]|nr:tail fiber protein [Flavobacteriaceae bacterium]|tara:strand:- start:2159 stop:2707 length:549 start_codon:yes stop_codon:yes gene_type:complete
MAITRLGPNQNAGIPTATIVPWSTASVPTGFLECDGSAVSRSTYSDLFSAIGTTYGAGDGSSTFTLPNLQDNIPMGKSGSKALASTGGANTVASTGNVGGSTANATLSVGQLASHQHDILYGNITGSQGYPYKNSGNGATTSQTYQSTGSGQGHSHNMSATFSGDATSVLQPYLTVIYVIKT